jgi:hypothetical protein
VSGTQVRSSIVLLGLNQGAVRASFIRMEGAGHLFGGDRFYTVRVRLVSGSVPLLSLIVETVPEKALLRRAPTMLFEPLHQCGIGALERGGRSATNRRTKVSSNPDRFRAGAHAS